MFAPFLEKANSVTLMQWCAKLSEIGRTLENKKTELAALVEDKQRAERQTFGQSGLLVDEQLESLRRRFPQADPGVLASFVEWCKVPEHKFIPLLLFCSPDYLNDSKSEMTSKDLRIFNDMFQMIESGKVENEE